jgi:outer membrane protein assembly factor BamB
MRRAISVKARLARGAAALLAVSSAALLMTACDPPSRYGPLHVEWSVQTADTIAATPAFSDGKVYMGSWDGYEYALDQASGTQRWRTFLGRYTNPCDTSGVTSSPAIQDGSAVLGGGDANWYSLNTTTGAKQWSLFVGDPSSGYYNWATPVTFNGYAYVGVSSLCDSPLVQGKLLRVRLTTGAVANTWKVVPDGQVGGTIWTTPAVDKARNKVYVTTGNRAYDSSGNNQKLAESMVAVDAATLAVKDYWSLPVSDPTPDADWGTGPVFLTDGQGRDPRATRTAACTPSIATRSASARCGRASSRSPPQGTSPPPAGSTPTATSTASGSIGPAGAPRSAGRPSTARCGP